MISRLRSISTLYSLWRHPYVGKEEIVCFQNEQLRHLVTHAYDNVRYYRRLFDQNGIKPNDIKSIDDLPKIPITSKKDLQFLLEEDVIARDVNPKNLIIHTTSGSSGEPLTIRRTWLEERLLGAIRLRAMRYLGQRFTDMTATISLSRTTDAVTKFPTIQTLGLYPWVQINCFLAPEKIIDTLQHLRPNIIAGFPGVISRLAQVLGNEDRPAIHPRFLALGGEVITPPMRRQIAEAFSAPVFSMYGAHEFNLVAGECKNTREFHICDDGVIVEVLKDGRPAAAGERGEVVGTNLHCFAMPFIRYRLGDIVTKGSETCGCGQPFSTIQAIQGRMIDYFPLPGGRMVHPYEIVLILMEAPWIRQYRIVQEREDRIVLYVVPSGVPTSQELIRLEQSVNTILGQDIEFRVILVPEIELEPNGKFRVSRSLVKSAYDEIDWNRP